MVTQHVLPQKPVPVAAPTTLACRTAVQQYATGATNGIREAAPINRGLPMLVQNFALMVSIVRLRRTAGCAWD